MQRNTEAGQDMEVKQTAVSATRYDSLLASLSPLYECHMPL